MPYHWGRFRGIAQDLGLPPLDEAVLGNVWFDTCVYHQAGIDLLVRVVPTENILFASEMLGAVRGVDPETGHPSTTPGATSTPPGSPTSSVSRSTPATPAGSSRASPRDDLGGLWFIGRVPDGNVITATNVRGASQAAPQTVSAVSTTLASLAHCSSAVSGVAFDGARETALRD